MKIVYLAISIILLFTGTVYGFEALRPKIGTEDITLRIQKLMLSISEVTIEKITPDKYAEYATILFGMQEEEQNEAIKIRREFGEPDEGMNPAIKIFGIMAQGLKAAATLDPDKSNVAALFVVTHKKEIIGAIAVSKLSYIEELNIEAIRTILAVRQRYQREYRTEDKPKNIGMLMRLKVFEWAVQNKLKTYADLISIKNEGSVKNLQKLCKLLGLSIKKHPKLISAYGESAYYHIIRFPQQAEHVIIKDTPQIDSLKKNLSDN